MKNQLTLQNEHKSLKLLSFSILSVLVFASAENVTANNETFSSRLLNRCGNFDSNDCESQANLCLESLTEIKKLAASDAKPEKWTTFPDLLFQTRKRIHKQLQRSNNPECTNAWVNAHDTALKAEEHWSLIGASKVRTPIFKATHPGHTIEDLTLPLNEMEFRSGDVLISHGGAGVSSLIARMPVLAPHSYSHMALVVAHPKSKRLYTVEAHIENGTSIQPLEMWLNDNKVRAAHYRLQGKPTLANRAALWAAKQVDQYLKKYGQNLPYDFSGILDDQEKWFCTEVVSQAYRALKPDLKIGDRASLMFANNPDFLNRIGIQSEQVFMPGDIMKDPNFELIREWRDLSKVERTWARDQEADRIYQKTLIEGLRIRSPDFNRAIAPILVQLRKIPGIGEQFLGKKIPTYIAPSTVELMLTLNDHIEKIQ